jgi:hypothetical protein
MRLPFGLELKKAAPATSSKAAAPVVFAPPVTASRRSYDDPLGYNISGYVKEPVDLALYDALATGIPFLDVALRKLARMIVPFEVECDNEATKDALTAWCKEVPVGYVNTGFQCFSRRHVRQVLQYGKSAGEIALAENRREIAGLFVVDSKTLRLVPELDDRGKTTGLLLGQDDKFGVTRVFEAQDLFVYTAFNGESDNPHGVSILRSVPWLADIVLRMENALRQKWQRSGAPSFLVQYQAPETTPDATLQEARSSMASEWEGGVRSRWEQQGITDFFGATPGVISVQAITDGMELQFVEPFRALMEQIVSITELAPFMLGLQWSTTERLSQQQADAIISCVDDYRSELEPDFLRILDWAQRTLGLAGTVSIEWADVSLQDRVETARADFTEAQAQALRQKNAEWLWRNGGTDQLGALQEAGYEIDAVVEVKDAPASQPQAEPSQEVPPAGGQDAGQGAFAFVSDYWRGYP